MLGSLGIAHDHFAAARRAQESLYLIVPDTPSATSGAVAAVHAADILLCRRPCPPSSDTVTPFGAVRCLDDLHYELSRAALVHLQDRRLDADEGDDPNDSSACSDEDSAVDEESVVKRLLCLDCTSAPAPCCLEQRLLRQPGPPLPNPDDLLREALGAPRKLSPWPAAVAATREQRFRPTWGPLDDETSQEPRALPPARTTSCGGGGLLSEAVCRDACSSTWLTSVDADPATVARARRQIMRPPLELEMPLLPPPPVRVLAHASTDASLAASDEVSSTRQPPSIKDGDPMLSQMLLGEERPAGTAEPELSPLAAKPPSVSAPSSRAPSASTPVAVLTMATSEVRRSIASRVLAPLSSARQRSERAQRLLSAALAPLCRPADEQSSRRSRKRTLASAICGTMPESSVRRSMLGGGVRGLEERLPEQPPPPSNSTAAPSDPVLRLLLPRPVLASASLLASAAPHPASGIRRAELAAHEAKVLERLLAKGDLCAQVRILPHPDGHAAALRHKQQPEKPPLGAVAAGPPPPPPPPLAEDAVVGALLTPRSGGAPLGGGGGGGLGGGGGGGLGGSSRGHVPAVSPLAAVLGLAPLELITYKRSLEPRAEAIAPPPPLRAPAAGSFSARLLGDEEEAEPPVSDPPLCDVGGSGVEGDLEARGRERGLAMAAAEKEEAAAAIETTQQQRRPPRPPPHDQDPTPPSRQDSSTASGTTATLPSPATIERVVPPAEVRPRMSAVLSAAEDDREPAGAFALSLDESFAESVDAFLQISHGLVPPPRHGGGGGSGGNKGSVAGGGGIAPSGGSVGGVGGVGGVGSGAARRLEEALPSKLLRHAHGSTGLLALLPECLCEHVPLIAAEVIATLAVADGVGVLWLLPEPMIESALAFWREYARLEPLSAQLSVRRLPYVPAAGTEEEPLGAGELGLAPLHSVLDLPEGGPSGGREPPASLVLLTATAPELAVCEALGERIVGAPPRCRLVGLVCGLPAGPRGGTLSLAPLCSALGVRRLLLRGECDPDVLALQATRKPVPFVVPPALAVAFDRLVSDATSELRELLARRPDLAPLPFESRALKRCIEQTNAQRRPGAMSDAEQATFWALMTAFCARRLVDCAEDADAASFGAFLGQVTRPLIVPLVPRLSTTTTS